MHELHHKACGSKDIRYIGEGLRPNQKKPTPLTRDEALKNADNWAVFGVDLLNWSPVNIKNWVNKDS